MKDESPSSASRGLDPLMTLVEVAIYLKVADTTVRKWCSKCLLPFALERRDECHGEASLTTKTDDSWEDNKTVADRVGRTANIPLTV
jgi:hypothetical protein